MVDLGKKVVFLKIAMNGLKVSLINQEGKWE